MTQSLLLDTVAWDLVLDAKGNIAVCSDPYATAQDVATALRTFAGECYYDTTRGVDYFGQILGQQPSASTIKALLTAEALKVDAVAQATCYLAFNPNTRQVSGQVQVQTTSGVLVAVGGPVAPTMPAGYLPNPNEAPPGQLDYSNPAQSGWIPV